MTALSTSQLFSTSPYLRRVSELNQQQFASISECLQQQLDNEDADIRKTHLFHGRYENIYMDQNSHPALQLLIAESLVIASDLLQAPREEITVGFWFNLMPPGHVTTLHSHDDMDELISAVVYLVAPENSGNLIIKFDDEDIELEPKIGHYLFFDPSIPHAVKENQSDSNRLSIGMNFGLKVNSLQQ